LKVLASKTDENSILLKGVIASRLAFADDEYAQEIASRFESYDRVEPDMKVSVVTALARSIADFETIFDNYKDRTSEEEKARFLGGLTAFKDPSLVSKTLGLLITGDIKKQHSLNVISGVMRNPDARAVSWDWIRENIDWLRKVYEGVGTVSRYLTHAIPYFGVGRSEEVKKYFATHKIPEAGMGIEAGMERLKINEDLLRRIAEAKH
jgi:aminopeptidase N